MRSKKLNVIISLLCLTITAISQKPMNKYEKAWQKIDSLVQKQGQTATALVEVNKIYALAKLERNNAQLIRSLVYTMDLSSTKEEESTIKNIQRLEKEIAASTEPARSIITSLLASEYWKFFEQQRSRLYDRSNTVDYKKSDINTWSTDDLHKKISALYLASVKNEQILRQTSLESYEPIILKGNSRKLRPSLFDLLTHRALGYFNNEERMVSQPAYAFRIDKASAFDPAADFITRKFPTKDSLSLHHKALLLYQRLLAFHLNDKDPSALIDVDLARLAFVYQHATMDEKTSLYTMALNHLAQHYGNHPSAAIAWATLAAHYTNQADVDTTATYHKPLEIARRIAAGSDSSEAKSLAQSIVNRIESKTLFFNAEKVNLPGQPFRMLAGYRNVEKIFIRVIALTPAILQDLNKNNWYTDEHWKYLSGLSPVRNYTQLLPGASDHRLHSVEIKIDPLPAGNYILLAGTNSGFTTVENNLTAQHFAVSNIAYLHNNNQFFVVNRESGAPLPRANVQVWYRYYDASTRKNVDRKGENLVTDKNGYFTISPSQTRNDNQFRLEITTTDDRLFLEDFNYNSYSQGEALPEEISYSSHLFTDRSIYRPGQTVWFKGLVLTTTGSKERPKIASGKSSTVLLYDANDEVIDSMAVTTSEFGTYSGKFKLPANRLNGTFYIRDSAHDGTVEISVEEYKRPKFSVTIPKPSGTYKVDDSIGIKGTALAFAGNNIDGASVKYRVVRRTRWRIFDYVPGKRIWPPRGQSEQEIANGITKTNEQGEFSFSFKAIPDASADKKAKPTFYYEVTADVTDINGETHSASTDVAVAYHSLELTINTPDQLPADSLDSLLIRTANLNDIFEKANVRVTISRLRQPERIFRARLWPQPDRFLFTEQEYHQLFPHDVYQNEDDPASWPRLEKIADYNDTSSINGRFRMAGAKLLPGWYVVEASAVDKYGEVITAKKQIQLTGSTNTEPRASAAIVPTKQSFEPGESLQYSIQTNLDSVWMIHHVTSADGKAQEQFIALTKNSKSLSLPMTENDRGGIGLDIAFVKHNRVYYENITLKIPYSNKELSFNFETFRDKTQPGSQEKWKVKIRGNKTDKILAEVLTSMYDASLDEFVKHEWTMPSIWQQTAYPQVWDGDQGFRMIRSQEKDYSEAPGIDYVKEYDRLLGDEYFSRSSGVESQKRYFMNKQEALDSDGSVPVLAGNISGSFLQKQSFTQLRTAEKEPLPASEKSKTPSVIQVRKNFNETAFFFPDLKTDSAGNIEFSFTMPEALTKWRWMLMAHTKDLSLGYAQQEIITQKDLMVQPNAPRFLREGDRMDFSTKIVNMTGKELTGQVELQMIDPSTNQPVDGWFRNFFPNQYFTAPAGQSVSTSFTIEIPFQYNKPVMYRVIARSGNTSDGEELMLPVVSNRILVTESLPLHVRGTGTRQFRFEKLLKSGESETLNHQGFTVEFTANPAWYAVQALPYMMQYPYECSEQVFNRYYANTLAAGIVRSSPRIKAIFEKWKTVDTSALVSSLEKNPELKSILLQETPWVLDAKNESQQKRNLALLFDLVRMNGELATHLDKLAGMQLENGGFSWFNGGRDDRYITQYILSGLGHLQKLGALPVNNETLDKIMSAGLSYLDKQIKEDYDQLVRSKANLAIQQVSYLQIQYLYMRSFYLGSSVPGDIFKAYNYYRKQSQQYWVKQGRYMQGMIALSLFRTGDVQTANNIIRSLKENSLRTDELGMYWKENTTAGYYWYQSPIDAHALLTEAFVEIDKSNSTVNDLKTWLLKQKQTNNWRTTRATADACYVLLLGGDNWLASEPNVNISVGEIKLSSSNSAEAGTGYFKKIIEGSRVKPEMGNITISVSAASQQPAWGSAYWQYFEELDKITPSSTPLKLVKKLFIVKQSDRGPVLQPLKEGDALHIGDKVKVRIELRVDRTLEYVHMKDMRAATMEPVNVLSSYKWQGGLGYYESTKDASTNFFFSSLPKGTWVFEYPVFVTHSGTFSNGITTVQCMYAPEFTSHSEGIKITVE